MTVGGIKRGKGRRVRAERAGREKREPGGALAKLIVVEVDTR